ncbi:unnamed protein product [Phytophthora lilii]|uniref:Unnamed protein product n=1 Tax=Phytophthora lilii TaxID=2077276 RepID=A0A9W6WY73_9STRA|nr:unnamed protein product [Phytophthora lilii]
MLTKKYHASSCNVFEDWTTWRETAVLLRLEVKDTALEIELIHIIDGNSPFNNQSEDDMARSDFVLILVTSGLDENLHDMVHKKREYGHESMRWCFKFLPMLDWDPHHKFIELDLDKISAVTPDPVYADDDVINVDTLEAVQENADALPSSSEENDDYNKSSPLHNSNEYRAEDTVPHKLADGSLWDDFDRNAILKKTDKDDQSYKCGPGVKEERQTVDPAKQTRSSYDRNSGLSHSASSIQDHDHRLTGNLEERPVSLLQRRVRVRNRSHRLLLNGLYQRALQATWPSLLMCLVVVYLAVVATIALLMSISVRKEFVRFRDESFYVVF